MFRKQGQRFLAAFLFLCFLISFTFSNFAIANTIQHINIGRVAVADQSVKSQQTAGKKALRQVFIKISGSSNIDSNDTVDRAIDNYEQYMVSSSFLLQDSNLYFEAHFNQQKIESLLLASGLPVWTNIRPNGLLWMAFKPELSNDNSKQNLITQNRDSALVSTIKQASFARGVDIAIPLGDFEDTVNVTYFDVSNHFLNKVRDGSVRYQPDYFLTASLEVIDIQQAQQTQRDILEERNRIRSSTSASDLEPSFREDTQSTVNNQPDFYNNEQPVILESQEASLNKDARINDSNATDLTMNIQSLVEVPIPDTARYKLDYVIAKKTDFSYQIVTTGRLYGETEVDTTKELIDIYTNTLAREFSLSTDNSSISHQFDISVSNIDSLKDQIEVVELLNSIPAIEKVSLVKQKGTFSTVRIEQKISLAQLISILSLDSRVSIVSGNFADENTILIDWRK